MANFVDNRLIITCKDDDLRTKIEKVIFMKNEKNEQVFTMNKLLPMPEGFEENPDYSDYGYYWCNAIWGTKWDVRYTKTIHSGDSYIFIYQTAWSSNIEWVDALWRYIKHISFLHKGNEEISVTLSFWKEYEEIGTQIIWTPGQGYEIKENVKFEPIIESSQSRESKYEN